MRHGPDPRDPGAARDPAGPRSGRTRSGWGPPCRTGRSGCRPAPVTRMRPPHSDAAGGLSAGGVGTASGVGAPLVVGSSTVPPRIMGAPSGSGRTRWIRAAVSHDRIAAVTPGRGPEPVAAAAAGTIPRDGAADHGPRAASRGHGITGRDQPRPAQLFVALRAGPAAGDGPPVRGPRRRPDPGHRLRHRHLCPPVPGVQRRRVRGRGGGRPRGGGQPGAAQHPAGLRRGAPLRGRHLRPGLLQRGHRACGR